MGDTRHIGEQHAVHTEDESLWINFHGRVPRVGEDVHTEDPTGWWTVKRVRWFIGEWLTEPGATDKVILSCARVLVVPREDDDA